MQQEIFNQRLQAVTSSMEAFRVGPLSVKVTNFHDSRRGVFTTTVHEHYYYEFCYVRNNSCIYQIHSGSRNGLDYVKAKVRFTEAGYLYVKFENYSWEIEYALAEEGKE